MSKTSNVVMSELTSTAVSDFPAFVRLKDKYKQELVEDGRLNKAADVAASREVLLTSHEPDAWKEPQLKAVGHELRQWVKCVRQPFGNLESPGANAAMEDGGASPLNHMMAQLVKNAASGQSPIKTPPNCRLPKTFKNSHTSGNSLNSKSKKVVAVARHSIDRVLNVTRRLSLDIREAIGRSQTKKRQSSTPSQTSS